MKGEETKRTFLLLPPAQVGAVQSIGVTAITVSNDRSGRHWGIRTCWWFWRGSKVSASCSAWSGRKEKEVETVLLVLSPPAPSPTKLQGLAIVQLVPLTEFTVSICVITLPNTCPQQKPQTKVSEAGVTIPALKKSGSQTEIRRQFTWHEWQGSKL